MGRFSRETKVIFQILNSALMLTSPILMTLLAKDLLSYFDIELDKENSFFDNEYFQNISLVNYSLGLLQNKSGWKFWDSVRFCLLSCYILMTVVSMSFFVVFYSLCINEWFVKKWSLLTGFIGRLSGIVG